VTHITINLLAMAHAPPLSLTLGPIQMGVIVSSVLWGVVCVQVYIYAISPNKDRVLLKLFVASIL
jgi:hypothetical protein